MRVLSFGAGQQSVALAVLMVQGTPGLEIYDGRDGKTHAKLTINATEVEFLTPKDPTTTEQPTNTYTPTANNTQDIPF